MATTMATGQGTRLPRADTIRLLPQAPEVASRSSSEPPTNPTNPTTEKGKARRSARRSLHHRSALHYCRDFDDLTVVVGVLITVSLADASRATRSEVVEGVLGRCLQRAGGIESIKNKVRKHHCRMPFEVEIWPYHTFDESVPYWLDYRGNLLKRSGD